MLLLLCHIFFHTKYFCEATWHLRPLQWDNALIQNTSFLDRLGHHLRRLRWVASKTQTLAKRVGIFENRISYSQTIFDSRSEE